MKSSLSSFSSNLSMTRSSSSSGNSDTQHPNLMKVKISHTNKLPQNKLQDPMLSPVRLVDTGTIKYTLGGYTGLTKNSSGASALDKLMKFEKKYSKPEIQSKKERNFPIEENKFIEGSSDLKHSSSLQSSFQHHSHVNQIPSGKIISDNHLNNSATRKYSNVTLDPNKVRNTEKDLEILENIQSLSQLDELISSNSAYSDNEYISDLSSSNDEGKGSKVSLSIKGDLKTKCGFSASRYNKFRSASPNKEAQKSSPRAVEDPSEMSFKNSSINPSTVPNSEMTFDSNQPHGMTHERQIKLKSSEERLDDVSSPANTMVIKSKSGLAKDIISDESKAEELTVITSVESEHYSPQSDEKELSIEKYLQTKIQSHNASISFVEPISQKNQTGESNNEEKFKIGIIRDNIHKNVSSTNLNLEPEDIEDTILSQDISRTLDESDEFYHNIPIKLHIVENLHNEDEEFVAVTKESSIKSKQKFNSCEEHTLENKSDHINEEILENLSSNEHSINYSTDIISDEEIVESKRSSASNFSVDENTRSSASFRSALVTQKPVETALNEMLRHQIDLTRHFMSAQYAMYEAYMKSVKMMSAGYKPVTLEDTKKFIEEHRRKKASY